MKRFGLHAGLWLAVSFQPERSAKGCGDKARSSAIVSLMWSGKRS